MKSLLRFTTMLLLLFGVGIMAPKMIEAAMIAQSDSRQNETTVSSFAADTQKKTVLEDMDARKEKLLSSQSEDKKTADQTEKIKENFPIKSAVDASTILASDSTSIIDTTTSVDSDSASVDKNGQALDAPASKPTEEAIREEPAAEKAAQNQITFKDVSYTRWVTTPLNMRKGPGIEHTALTSIPMGKEVKVTKLASNGWAEVAYNGKTGFVSGKYLSESIVIKPAPAPEEKKDTPETRPAEPSPAPTPAPTPTPTPTPAPAPAPAPAPKPSYEAYKMYIGGKAITYKNGGQSDGQRIIDSNSSVISTWGGAATYSGTDGKNTHFIGHNPGVFSVMFNVSTGNKIIVTDAKGSPTTYKITRIFKVDDYGVNPSDGENYYNYLTSTRGGEVITLQTCINSNLNLIIRAEKIS